MFRQIKYCFLLCVFFFSGCSAFCKEQVPYIIDAKLNMEDSSDFDIAGLDLSFLNRSERTVNEFSIVFYIFDEDGEPASLCRSNVVLSVKCELLPGEKIEKCLNLDSFFSVVPDEEYSLDYVYISRIKYADGSVWKDPFGLSLY